MIHPQRLLRDSNFLKTHYVENRASVADLFRPGHRCGIYVLHFANDEYYIGQAVDVTRRYVQHCKNHSDIVEISFRKVSQKKLDDVEREMIGLFERKGIPLRNIALTSIPRGESDFDLVMGESEQQRWLSDVEYQDWAGERPVEPALRQKYEHKFEQFKRKPHASAAIEILHEYVRKTVPAARRGEISFWGSSCLPAYHSPGVTIYSRININWQEVFTISSEDDVLQFSWHVARSPLEVAFGPSLAKLKRTYRGIEITDHTYTPGGQDQVNFYVQDIEQAHELLQKEPILKSIRLFNYRLMKKGPCVYSRNHCLALADKLLD